MKILFYFGHPAQYLFLRETIRRLLGSEQHKIIIVIKTKDVLEQLLIDDKVDYINILPKVRGRSKLAIASSLVRRNWTLLPILLREKPDLLIGTDATIAQLGSLLNINRITVIEDDYDVVRSLGQLTYPFTQTILCPQVCKVGRWGSKKIGYEGYMKLGYLHPNVFTLKKEITQKYNLPERFLLVRLSQLGAHHDFGISGISHSLLAKIIQIAEKRNYRIFISSEETLNATYRPYQLAVSPSDLHQVLALASLLVCDSQSMTVEAAMLGTPSLRYSDLAGRISVLEELEHVYQLTFGIATGSDNRMLTKLGELLDTPNLREIYQDRKRKMLTNKIDVSAFLLWFIENYPDSKKTLQQDPQFQKQFIN